MLLTKKKKITAMVFVLLAIMGISIQFVPAAYLPTTRDTKLPPETVTYDLTTFDEYELLYETDTMCYYYREDRDIIAIFDKRNSYTWKTGIDAPYGADMTEAVAAAETEEEALAIAEPIEAWMSSTYLAIANSLITVEYYEADTVKTISSASREGVDSKLVTLNNNPATRRLDIDFYGLGVNVSVEITFHEDSITYEIPYENVSGVGKNKIASINITPFLGASGGKQRLFDTETGEYPNDQESFVEKYRVPGYILIPDGSGSLIRMNDNTSTFANYNGTVYGIDPASKAYYNEFLLDSVPLQEPTMPVFGIAHGDRQAAFVAYAEKSAEYMEIVVRPEQNMTFYNWAYPRFRYNMSYFQIYNNRGEGFFQTMENGNQLDIVMTYSFLAGDGTNDDYPADYVGMAKKYRDHLLSAGELVDSLAADGDIPLRLDFIMSESKKGIISNEEVVMTTTEDIRDILTTLKNDFGLSNLNSGLIGWQKSGESLSKPYKSTTSKSVGSKKEFKKLLTDFAEQGIDISYSRDYIAINRSMMSFNGNATKHLNSWYVEVDKEVILPYNAIETVFGYATPKNSTKWMLKQFEYMKDHSESMTITGISNVLTSSYTRNGVETTAAEAIDLYREAMEKIKGSLKVNLEAPNQYLWKYTDRYLQSPVGSSQYLFETDTVPFLQLVLNGTMEMYAPYSNFSFYTQSDILRIIDYNLSPSFILSKEPSYLLADTISAHLYSTEYDQYEELICDIYGTVNEILSQVSGFEWLDRIVLMNGVILNSYQKDGQEKQVLINYTDAAYTYDSYTIAPLSAVVMN